MDYLIIALCALSLMLSAVTLAVVLSAKKRAEGDRSSEYLQQAISDRLGAELRELRAEMSGELRESRRESSAAVSSGLRDSSAMQNAALVKLSQEMTVSLGTLRRSVAEMSGGLDTRMEAIRTTMETRLTAMSRATDEKLDAERAAMETRLTEMSGNSDAKLEAVRTTMETRLTIMSGSTDAKLEAIRGTMETRLAAMQADNQRKLDEIRGTVDERLQKTLEEKVSQSFRLVNERLEQVYKGLGEMQTLATGVGDLKKVLSNVKTRGIMGELQLGRILEQILTPSQYDTNVVTKRGSRDPVEFAIRLPGRGEEDGPVYLPIDSKFPTEDYSALLDAYETSDKAQIDAAGRELESTIRRCARDISDKYIDPPHTTDFAVLFLPFEGLYAEVVRRNGLLEALQRDYRINVAGPSTLSALLNSLQLGFRTLAIEKRSTEVWNLLAAVKTEFGNFNKVLLSAQDRITRASADIDTLVGVRTRKIMGKLKTVDELPAEQAALMIGAPDSGSSAGDNDEHSES